MDDDLAEMAALRARSERYKEHQKQYGDRASAKREREMEEQRIRTKLEVEKEKQEQARAQRKAEIEKATQEMMGALPTEFGMKKDDGKGDIHKKRQREDIDQQAIDKTIKKIQKLKLPVTCEVVLAHGTKTIGALGLDPKGGRLLTGGYDYTVKMWDFAGMTQSLQSFREMDPEEGHLVKQLRYNKGGKFLAITGYRCAGIFTRDGHREFKCSRGDMYIHDLLHTYGHVAALTDGHWNPKDETEFLTSSEDGTMRIWDIGVERRSKECIKLKPRSGGRRTPVTSCAFSPDGSMIAGAGRLGSLQIWERKKGRTGPRAKKRVFDAHTPQTETSCLMFASDNRYLVSRGGDHTVKLWDVRKFKRPIKVWEGLENLYPTSDVAFSPKGDLIVCGTSNREETGGQGSLVFLSRKKKKEVARIRICQASVVRVLWNARLNQIICGCADGAARVLYDPEVSKNGALLCVGKKAKRKSIMDFSNFVNVHNPNALPLFAQTQSEKRIKKKQRKDPVASKKPLPPLKGDQGGVQGRLGSHNLTTHLMQVIAKRTVTKEDPRDALLAWDKKAKQDPMFFGNAYKHSQPEEIFAEEEEEEDDDKVAAIKKKISSAPLGADPTSYRKEWK